MKYTETAQRKLKKLYRSVALRVLGYMDERIATVEVPRSQVKILVGPTMGFYWRYRVGDVRLICDLQDHALLILLIAIGLRREANRTKR